MYTATDLMTTELNALSLKASIFDAIQLSKDNNIRNIPVVDDQGHLLGVISQKSLFNKTMHMLALYGTEYSVKLEQETSVKEVLETDYLTAQESTSLDDIIPLFKGNNHGCLPVIDADNKLKGFITSGNFVDFCERLLLNNQLITSPAV
ncbi:CBS domain-containing protein [Alteromonas sp. a30]|uniref:CBS domain-containing protein n=1 Tax=Alteromonas sp. a30 TaxID=2730917 RepID=UPI00227E8DCA|nr:CBS domain-containing protein [Alteromonas sp. a30]MCY7293951.1 CBS domain-containing protein [Alteromonas sp. a30]